MERSWSIAAVLQGITQLDPLALSLACRFCRRGTVTPFTLEGVLWDGCPGCGHVAIVPLRRPKAEVVVWKGAA